MHSDFCTKIILFLIELMYCMAANVVLVAYVMVVRISKYSIREA